MKLKMDGICKSFGSNEVLKSVGFQLGEGEICALLGENGAGKSTLMNILGGVLQPDSGDILLDGEKKTFDSPAQSLDAGIAFIHQELNLINDLPIYENMFIGRELKKKNGLLDHKRMIEETRRVFERMGLTLDPKEMVRNLDASYKQIVEISRALLMNAKMIIMVFISHKLREVMEICDSYTVLRDGVMVASGSVKDVTTSDLARFMVGHDVRTEKLGTGAQRGEERLSLHGVTQEPYFRNVDLTAYAGEVLGVTGLLGDGRSELFSAVFGAETVSAGEIRLCGNPVRITSTWQAKQLGLAYVPRNRKENGIIKDMSILENGTIVSWRELMRHGLLDHARQRAQFEREKAALHIKMGKESDSITSLSGGNQQKVVLAKWLSCKPKVLILDNPTQGVDVGAKEEIYDIILKLAKEGVAVIVLSSEAQELEIMRLATGG